MKALSKKRKNDLLLIAILLFFALICLFSITLSKKEGAIIQIVRNKSVMDSYPLAIEQQIELSDESGRNTLLIQNGKAQIIDADCPDGLCMHQNPIRYNGETIVCLPHKLVIRVVSGEEGEVDIAT